MRLSAGTIGAVAEPKEIKDAHEEARRIRHEAERRARDTTEEARKQSAAMLAEARACADAALEDAKRLRDALAKSAEALTGEADRLVRDVQLAHRELLASLRLPGVSERDAPRRSRPGPSAEDLFEPPDWIRGR
jgi:cell division septum initiation protein DivIVA